MNRILFSIVIFVVMLAAGCRSSRPAIVDETESCAADTTIMQRRDSVDVVQETGHAHASLKREVCDSIITHIVSGDSTATIIRSYHTERSDVDLSVLLERLDSLATCRVDSVAGSKQSERERPVVIEGEKGLSFWEQLKMRIGGVCLWSVVFYVIIVLLRKKFRNG